MVNRPDNWDTMTPEEQMKWLREQQHQPRKGIGGPRTKLTEKDKERIWGMLQTFNNQSLVAQQLGVSRRTLIRYMEKNPLPDSPAIEARVEDYAEIKAWVNRQNAYSKERYVKQYLYYIARFYNWQREHHPERARPRLWTSDDILEYINTLPDHAQYEALTPMRQLGKKAPKEFPMIDVSQMPCRRYHKKRRSLAGIVKHYLDIDQVRQLREDVPDYEVYRKNGKSIKQPVDNPSLIKARNKAIIDWLFNIAIRTGSASTEKGLLGIRIENLHLDEHWARVQDKGDIWWHVKGLCDELLEDTKEYLTLRGNPNEGFLFLDNDGAPLSMSHVNNMLKEAGERAGITGKALQCKTFRKSLVKHALEELGLNPMSLVGTGTNPKTCFCVGWTDIRVLLQHYAPKMEKTIEKDRNKLSFSADWRDVLQKRRTDEVRQLLSQHGIKFDESQLGTILAIVNALA